MFDESEFADVYTDTITPVVEQFIEPFNKVLGDDLFNTGKVINENVRDFISFIRSTGPSFNTIAHQQSYDLFVVAVCMMTRLKKFDETEFYEDYYYPMLYSMLSDHLDTFRRLLSKHDSKIYEHIEEKASDVIGFSLAVYNLSSNIIKVDTRKIFLKTSFLEASPTTIPDIQTYYYLQLQYIYYEYIKSKTQGLIPIDELVGLQQQSFSNHSRSSIYEYGIRNHRIKMMCSNSDTLQTISNNYDKLRKSILPNKFITLFKQSTGMDIKDSKTVTVYLNSLNLSDLEKEFPLICKLLRAVHVTSKVDSFTDAEKVSLRNVIYLGTKTILEPKIGEQSSQQIAASLAMTVCNDLVTGEYIDPRSMTKIKISSNVFTSQFQKFLKIILEDIIQNAA